MIKVIILIIIFLSFLVFSYLYFKKDIAQPSVLFFFSYFASLLCLLINVNKWNVDLSIKTMLILILGGTEFLIISIVIDKIYLRKKNIKKKSHKIIKKIEKLFDNFKQSEINVKTWKIIAIIIYELIIIVLVYYNVSKIASIFGNYNSISEMLHLYKENTSYSLNASLPQYVNYLLKPNYLLVYVCAYLFINNMIFAKSSNKNKILKNVILIIPIIIFIFQELLLSQRLSIMSLVIGIVVIFLVLLNAKYRYCKPILISLIIKLLLVGIIGLILFYMSASWIGRVNKNNMVDYITLYVGGSVECLDLYIKNPVEKSNIIGKETFQGLINGLDNYNIIKLDKKYIKHLEFRYSNDVMVGNVYTAYRRWMQDFGIIGLIILQAIFAIFYNIFYQVIKRMIINKKNYGFLLIVYAFLSYGLVLHFIDSYLFDIITRLSFIPNIILIGMIYLFLSRDNIISDYIKG